MSVSMLKGLHRRVLGFTKDDQLIAKGGVIAGGDGKPAIVSSGPDTVAVFEDFIGGPNQAADTGIPIGDGSFRRLAGDTGHHGTLIAGTNGVFRLFSTPSVGAAKVAAAGMGIGGALQWKANQGPNTGVGRLRMGARVKFEAVSQGPINRVHSFIGFTDVATFEYPAFDTGAGVISAADDFVGFMLSAGTAAPGWHAVAGNATADQVLSLGVAPTSNVYDVVEVELERSVSNPNGKATFFVNGQARGVISAPVATNVALAPAIYAFQQDTGMEYVDIDWVNVSAVRDTGL